MAQRKTLVVDARVAVLSASTRAVLVDRGGIIFERGGRSFVLDGREREALAVLLVGVVGKGEAS